MNDIGAAVRDLTGRLSAIMPAYPIARNYDHAELSSAKATWLNGQSARENLAEAEIRYWSDVSFVSLYRRQPDLFPTASSALLPVMDQSGLFWEEPAPAEGLAWYAVYPRCNRAAFRDEPIAVLKGEPRLQYQLRHFRWFWKRFFPDLPRFPEGEIW